MARKLPWAVTATAPSKTPKLESHDDQLPPAVKREDDAVRTKEQATLLSTPQKQGKYANPRSPSTSPLKPPSHPVPQVEFMRSGLLHDDIYIMVEDEFESQARRFTAHLHAAEYARLRRKAREAPPRALPELSDLSPSAPRATEMSLERKRLSTRQGKWMDNMGARKKVKRGIPDGRPMRDNGGEEGQEEEDESVESGDNDNDDDDSLDPWSGTSLASLMGESARAKKSLVGLERLDSGTRAARGFGRAETAGLSRKKQNLADEDTFRGDTRRSEMTRGNGEEIRSFRQVDKIRRDARGEEGNEMGLEELPFSRPRKGDTGKGKEVLRDKIPVSNSPRSGNHKSCVYNDEDDERLNHTKTTATPSTSVSKPGRNGNKTTSSDSRPFPSRATNLNPASKSSFMPASRSNPTPVKRSFIEFDDEFTKPDHNHNHNQKSKYSTSLITSSSTYHKPNIATLATTSTKTMTTSTSAKVNVRKDRKSRLDEVPVFLA